MLRQLKQTVLQKESLTLIYLVSLFCFLGYHDYFGLFPAKYGIVERAITRGAFLLGTSFLFSLLVLRENPLELGLGLGDCQTWAKYSLLFALLMGTVILIASRADESFARYYPAYKPARDSHRVFLLYSLSGVFYVLAWEYFFRGFLLFSLEKKYGDFAVVLQMVPFVILHVGKPELEAYSSILGGLILGVLALRTRSMWPCFLIHAFVAVWMDVCVVYIWR